MMSELELKSKHVRKKHSERLFLIVFHKTDYKCGILFLFHENRFVKHGSFFLLDFIISYHLMSGADITRHISSP